MSYQESQIAASNSTNRTFGKSFRFAAATAAVVVAVAFGAETATAGAPSSNSNTTPQNVNVVNTPTVNVSNTPTVNVGNTPAVTLSGTPAVTLSGTPAVGATVNNTSANPVPTVDSEKLARIPYQATRVQSTTTCAGGFINGCEFDFPAPPSGYRLVVENISAYLLLNPNAQAPVGFLDNLHSGGEQQWDFTASLGLSIPNSVTYATVNQPVIAIFDSTDNFPKVEILADWYPSPSQNDFVTLSGHLEKCAITGCPARVE